jgi:EAL domain-containing protein (putative c-di-GMP-specific phosphodiesterase class I)
MLLHDINDAIEKLTLLKNYGIHISLDDFGTGYSSLSYLKSLPIDEIKIDRSFVNDIINDQQANVMVKSIVDLGHNFNLGVVSEGVETKAQYDLLKSYGITCYQGFYFSKPLPINDFDLLLKNIIKKLDTV